jgi:hypothetical protein
MPSHPLGHFEVGGVELPRLVREKNIECQPSALVRLEKRYVAEHLRRFATLRQNYLPIGP